MGTVGPIHEVMAVEMGRDERLETGRLVGVDQGESGLAFLVENEETRDPGLVGQRLTDDAAAVDLAKPHDVADGLVAEPEAPPLFLGQPFRGDAGVQRGKVEAAPGRVLELEVLFAGRPEFLEVLADPLIGLRRVEQGLERRPLVLEK